jgi:hypothetical protein
MRYYGVKGGTVQGDERSFFGALRVAGHGTGSARSGVDIGCSHKRVGAFCRLDLGVREKRGEGYIGEAEKGARAVARMQPAPS